MIRCFWVLMPTLFLLIFFSNISLAESNYVLPYPSGMPGSKLYTIKLIWEKISKFWYFGDLGQFKYNLKYSDKYLVEAKTLFEYRQYLLGISALKKSDSYFLKTIHYIKADQKKDISHNKLFLKEAEIKHREVLRSLEEIPKTFNWEPEKSSSIFLDLAKSIDSAINIRKRVL